MICAKCGINSKDDSSLTFHRFPLPSVRDSLKAKVWAKFCFPDEDWTSDQSLRSLYKQHKMLCADFDVFGVLYRQRAPYHFQGIAATIYSSQQTR
ncbi:unnamed protein product, partial [Iphiclides podalirius]